MVSAEACILIGYVGSPFIIFSGYDDGALISKHSQLSFLINSDNDCSPAPVILSGYECSPPIFSEYE
jgi:hypothetical protein